MSDTTSDATAAAAAVTAAVNAVAATPDAIIAPEHEGRLQKIEDIFRQWEPLLMKVATIVEKVID